MQCNAICLPMYQLPAHRPRERIVQYHQGRGGCAFKPLKAAAGNSVYIRRWVECACGLPPDYVCM